jgi:hypothetical protein
MNTVHAPSSASIPSNQRPVSAEASSARYSPDERIPAVVEFDEMFGAMEIERESYEPAPVMTSSPACPPSGDRHHSIGRFFTLVSFMRRLVARS